MVFIHREPSQPNFISFDQYALKWKFQINYATDMDTTKPSLALILNTVWSSKRRY